MLSDISIKNFRGIKEGRVGTFSSINIFIGANNSGKSSFLESISFLSTIVDPSMSYGIFESRLYNLIRRRLPGSDSQIIPVEILESLKYKDIGDRVISTTPIEDRLYGYVSQIIDRKRDSLWHDYQIDKPIELHVKTSDQYYEFQFHNNNVWTIVDPTYPDFEIRSLIRDPNIILSQKQSGTSTSANKSDFRNQLPVILKGNHIDTQIVTLLDELDRCQLFDADIKNLPHLLQSKFFKRLLAVRKDRELIRILNDAYNTNIESFSFVPKSGNDLDLFAVLPHKSINIDEMGDGFKLSFNLLLYILAEKIKLILIEEIENHQHPRALRYLIKALTQYSLTQDAQLFITTHSIDFIEYITKEDLQEKLKMFYFDLDSNGTLKAKQLSSTDSQNIQDIAIDLRSLSDYI